MSRLEIARIFSARNGIWLPLFFASFCPAQEWEVGGAVGYGAYRNASVLSPAGTAVAGVRNRYALSASTCHDMYEHLSGEIRYSYQDGDPFLAAEAAETNLQGHSHAIHYDLLFHVRPRSRRFRPYVAAGLGAKQYVSHGPREPLPPLSSIAALAVNSEVKPLVSLGGGLKLRISRHLNLHFAFRDYLTPFPKKLFVPADGGRARGFLHQFTPFAGVGYEF